MCHVGMLLTGNQAVEKFIAICIVFALSVNCSLRDIQVIC